MKIAIHHRPGSFSERWLAYCQQEGIEYKIVDCFQSDIVEQVKDCDALMWHHHHAHFKDALTAKRILFALEHAGIKVFPDFKTGWHFDDKVAQKYLLKAIDAPLVPSYVFYDKNTAIEWVNKTTFPKVFKLTRGAGSANVSLVRSKSEAVKKINTAFRSGFSQYNRFGSLKDRFSKWRVGRGSFLSVAKGLGRLVIPTEFAKMHSREKGYVYFQEFIPNNEFDIRIVIVGEKAFALKRYVRENDFRASGSGKIEYSKDSIDLRCVEISFEVNKKINSQSIAYDYIFDENNKPLIVEISYGYDTLAYDSCPGYWDSNLKWYEGKFKPQEWMVDGIIQEIKENKNKH